MIQAGTFPEFRARPSKIVVVVKSAEEKIETDVTGNMSGIKRGFSFRSFFFRNEGRAILMGEGTQI